MTTWDISGIRPKGPRSDPAASRTLREVSLLKNPVKNLPLPLKHCSPELAIQLELRNKLHFAAIGAPGPQQREGALKGALPPNLALLHVSCIVLSRSNAQEHVLRGARVTGCIRISRQVRGSFITLLA